MKLATETEIRKSIPHLDCKWNKQNDIQDYDTGFIYYCKRYEQVIDLAISNECDIDYAVHRWYNFQCSKQVENLFCKYGAMHYANEKDHNTDITIQGIPFDVKLSIISNKYTGDTNLSNRKNKDKYIKWLNDNQSNESRKHTKNKLYVVCMPRNTQDNKLISKSKFSAIESKIRSFMAYFIRNINSYEKLDTINELIFVKCN